MNAFDQILKAEQGFAGEFGGNIFCLGACDYEAVIPRVRLGSEDGDCEKGSGAVVASGEKRS